MLPYNDKVFFDRKIERACRTGFLGALNKILTVGYMVKGKKHRKIYADHVGISKFNGFNAPLDEIVLIKCQIQRILHIEHRDNLDLALLKTDLYI